LELQAAEALERPETIAHVVVAMLNADGGEIWIGLRTHDGMAVEIQGIPDPRRAAATLRESLVDRLNPSPLPEEVEIETVPHGRGIALLRITVMPRAERKPYALTRSGAWYFPVRVGTSSRAMSREEIFRHTGKDRGVESRLDASIRNVLDEREAARASLRDRMWLCLEPASAITLDLQAPRLEELAANPETSGNRRIGWHFARASRAPRLGKDTLRWEWEEALAVEVRARGGLLFEASLKALHWKGDDHALWPLSVLEYPMSAFRIAKGIYEGTLGIEERVVADLAFFGIRGWTLKSGSPLDPHFFRLVTPIVYPGPDEDLTWTKPLVFELRDVLETPDRCGFRLVRRVYEAFGLRERDMPPEYDRDSGRLLLPD